MADIVLAAINAKYIHPALGLRYLFANLGPLIPQARLLEFDLRKPTRDVATAILAHEPRIVGLGVHIWNTRLVAEVITLLKADRPDLVIVLGGPEVSFDAADHETCRQADYIITGEADLEFSDLCSAILGGSRPASRIIPAAPVELETLALPYPLYTADDLAHRLTYVETSRGCPYACEYCISARDVALRYFPLPRVFEAFDDLLQRGARRFKFVDRTFNVDIPRAITILEFFLERMQPGLFVHFEMVPERFPEELRQVIRRFPDGSLQFEIGIQTFNTDVAARIKRTMDAPRIEENLRFLRNDTHAHIHADLIAGLPGESMDSFAAGFDRLLALQPHEIQVGILKRLRGAPIARHDAEWSMEYDTEPPYEILGNRLIARNDMDRLRHFARFWEVIANRGDFACAAPMIWREQPSAFHAFMELSDWLFARFGRHFGIPLEELSEAIFDFLTGTRGIKTTEVTDALSRDYTDGRPLRRLPKFLRTEVD